MILPDVLSTGLDVVFCGMAAGNKSASVHAYYAGSGNKFYSIICRIGLTPHRLPPSDFRELSRYKIGLTDLAKHTSGNDNTLKHSDFDTEGFLEKIKMYKPKLVAFNGKAPAAVFLYQDKTKTGLINYGFLDIKVGKTMFYVLPSTSGSANSSWDENLWYDLAAWIKMKKS